MGHNVLPHQKSWNLADGILQHHPASLYLQFNVRDINILFVFQNLINRIELNFRFNYARDLARGFTGCAFFMSLPMSHSRMYRLR